MRVPSSPKSLTLKPKNPHYEQSSYENTIKGTHEQYPMLKKVVNRSKRDHVSLGSYYWFYTKCRTGSLKGDKTQLTATLDDNVSFEAKLLRGPRCQETMGEDSVHTRYDTTSKLHSNDLPKVGTPSEGGEDRCTHYELLDFCSTLNVKINDQKEINEQKERVHNAKEDGA